MIYTSFQELIDSIYEASLKPELWTSTLERLSEELGLTGMAILSATSAAVPPCHSGRLERAVDDYVREGWFSRNVRIQQIAARRGSGGGFGASELYTESTLFEGDGDKSDIQRGLFDRHGLTRFCGAGLEVGKDSLLILDFERSSAESAFNHDELRRLDTICAHLTKAARVATALATARAEAVVEAFESLSMPTALLRGGVVSRHNASFDAYLGRSLSLRGGRLRHVRKDVEHALAAAIFATETGISDGSGVTRPVMLPMKGRPPVIASLMPLRRSALDVFGGAATLLLLRDPLSERNAAPKEVLQAVYGLSPAEAQLASFLARGESLADAARLQGVTRNTARNRLATVFAKTGASRQSELVGLISRLDGMW